MEFGVEVKHVVLDLLIEIQPDLVLSFGEKLKTSCNVPQKLSILFFLCVQYTIGLIKMN